MFELGIYDQAEALKQAKISAVELTQTYLKQAKALSHLNAFISLDAEHALASAQQSDTRRAKHQELSMLDGISIAHKDVFVTTDFASSAGSKMLQGYRSPFDATVVARLKAAGTVCLGKTNMDEFAMGSSNEHSYFGNVLNPWDLSRVPGGSSGGAAVAVASQSVVAATGSDTGGSVRQPAAFCGVSGIKPTYGRCSRYGMIAFASSLDQAGVFARRIEDCALLLQTMSGVDTNDSTSRAAPPQAQNLLAKIHQTWQLNTAASDRPLQGLRIGIPGEYFGPGLNTAVHNAINKALADMQKLGAVLVEVSLPRTQLSIPAYYIIASAEASSNLARFDGVRYGHRAKAFSDLQSLYENSRSEGFGDEVKRRIVLGSFVLSHGYYDAYYVKAQKLRRMLAQDFQNAFQHCDVIASPVAPDCAWQLGASAHDPIAMYLADIYTLSVSLAGLPALSIPVGFNTAQHPLPIGMQLIGNYWQEPELIQVAHHYQNQSDWHLRQPQIPQQEAL